MNAIPQHQAAYADVVAVLGDYFDGLYHGDTTRLRRVFHPRAQYVCAVGGTLQCLTMDAYFPVVDARPSPASRAETRADEIRSIAFAGPVTAVARVRCRIGDRHFDDILSLIHVDGRWQIVAKVFDYTLNPTENPDALREHQDHARRRDPRAEGRADQRRDAAAR